jgi:hypothetical protein
MFFCCGPNLLFIIMNIYFTLYVSNLPTLILDNMRARGFFLWRLRWAPHVFFSSAPGGEKGVNGTPGPRRGGKFESDVGA